jgi:hypothetical protein
MTGGRPPYAAQKSVVVDDFAKRLRPSLGDISANAIEDMLHSPARQGIPGDFFIPRINLAEFELGKPCQKFLSLAQRERLHLLGNLLYAGRHAVIIAPAAIVGQSRDGPPNCGGSANDRDEQIAGLDSQLRRTLPRSCSIAWFGARLQFQSPFDDIFERGHKQHQPNFKHAAFH